MIIHYIHRLKVDSLQVPSFFCYSRLVPKTTANNNIGGGITDNKKMTLNELMGALEAAGEDVYCCWCDGECGTAISEYGCGGGAILHMAWACGLDDPDPSSDYCYCPECYKKFKAEEKNSAQEDEYQWAAAWQQLIDQDYGR